MHLFKRILMVVGFILSLGMVTTLPAQAQAEHSIEGRWKTIDDVTGKPKGIIQIKKGANGEYVGIIEETFPVNGEQPVKTCGKCTGERKNQPIIGMTVMWGMKDDGKGAYSGGEILDPKIGKIYSCKANLDPNGDRLTVRGYLGVSLLGRSQTWVRV
jgi:uncharacterized protein (DUF2147 family)